MDTTIPGAPAPAVPLASPAPTPEGSSVVVPDPAAAVAVAVDPAAPPAAEAEKLLGDPPGFQRRIDRLTAQKYGAVARAESAERQLAQLQTRLATGVPNPQAYQDPAQLLADTMRHVGAETQAEGLKREVAMARAEAADIDHSEWMGKIDARRATLPDADIVMREPDQGGPTITPSMAEMIRTTENGFDVAYHLAKNAALSRQIASLSPVQQIFELGRISQRLTAPTLKPSAAPPPVPTVGGRPTASAVSLEQMSNADFIRMRNEEERKGGGLW